MALKPIVGVVRNRTGFRGVSVRRDGKVRRRPFQAIIHIGDRLKSLGAFETPEEAALAYDEKAKELFGDRARLNFPLRGEMGTLIGYRYEQQSCVNGHSYPENMMPGGECRRCKRDSEKLAVADGRKWPRTEDQREWKRQYIREWCKIRRQANARLPPA